jgi:hypothetical protein
MGLTNMSDLKYLGMTVNQVQCNVGVTNMLNPKNLDLVVS